MKWLKRIWIILSKNRGEYFEKKDFIDNSFVDYDHDFWF